MSQNFMDDVVLLQDPKFEKKYIALVLGCFMLLGSLFAIFTPFNQAPDEAAHATYIISLVQNLSLPDATLTAGSRIRRRSYDLEVQQAKASLREGLPSFKRQEQYAHDDRNYFMEFYQPPLYYFLAVPLYALSREAMGVNWYVAVRLLSVVFGALMVFGIWRAARIIFGPGFLSLLVPTFVFAIPMVTHISSSINNDSLANFLGVVLVLLGLIAMRVREEKLFRLLGVLGAVMGFAFLTKISLLPLIVLVGGAACLRLRTVKLAVRHAALLVGAFGITAGPFMVWNWVRYGDILLLSQIKPEFFPEQRAAALNAITAIEWSRNVFESFIGRFGYFDIPLESDIYLLFKFIFILGIFGLFTYLVRTRNTQGQQRKDELFLGAVLLLTVVALVAFNLRFWQPQGRYLFPALISVAVGIAIGVREVLPERFHVGALFFLFALAFFTNIAALLNILSYTA